MDDENGPLQRDAGGGLLVCRWGQMAAPGSVVGQASAVAHGQAPRS